MAGIIKLDCSPTSVVITCDVCTFWHAFALSKAEAWARAVAHEERVHPGVFHQRKAADQRARHAAHS